MKKIVYFSLFVFFLTSLIFVPSVLGYENSEFGFTIDPPPMWDVNEDTGVYYIPVSFVDPYTRSSINIGAEETHLSFWDYLDSEKDVLEGMYDDLNFISEMSRVVGGLDCYEIVYTGTIFDGTLLKWKQILFLEDGMFYAITCTAAESEYSNSLLYFEDSINSFRLTSNPAILPFNLDMVVIVGLVVVVIAVLLVLFMFIKKKDIQSSIQQTDSSYVSPSSIDVTVSVDSGPRFCRNCGAETKIDTIFCENCGKQVKE